MKVLISLYIPQLGIDMLQARPDLKVTVWDKSRLMTHEELISQSRDHDILLSGSPYKINKEFIEQCAHLKLISQFSAGYDNVDLAALKEKQIPFANAPGAMNNATADVAFGLMVAVSRRMFFMHKRIPNGEWGQFQPRANLGLEQNGKNLGVFGLGKIGMEMARRCKGAYDMKIFYHNRNRNPEAEKELGAEYVSFEKLLELSDVLSVHSGLSSETKEIFDLKAFQKMRPNAIFINTARGGIHNEKDLIQALEQKMIWGAGLDVTNPEPMKPDNPLLSMDTVCVLPHIGSATVPSRDEMSRLVAMNIIEFMDGKKITNQVFE